MSTLITFIQKHRYAVLILTILLIHACNLFIDVIEIDAAQYASISAEMFRTHSYLQVFHRSLDYLDKPPLLFWSASLSYFIFGVSNFAYKLIPLLTLFLGVYSTYRYASLWYNKESAKLSAIILASCQGYFLMTNDVRTDGLLTGWVIFSVWMLAEYLQKNKWQYLVFAAMGAGMGMLAKGPIALVCIGAAMGGELLIKKKYSAIFKFQWIWFLLIIAVILTPMTYGLYKQFDLHPEKVVYDLQGPSGVKFFFWTQSFGRITGDIYWANDTTFFYFFHTILWDFQPWIILLIASFVFMIYKLLKRDFKSLQMPEYASLCGFILVFIMLSTSNYKLPHYIFVIFPFASILVASYLSKVSESTIKLLSRIQFVIIQLFFCLIISSYLFFFSPTNPILPIICLCMWILVWLLFYRTSGIEKFVLPTLILVIALNATLTFHLYPNWIKYQAGSFAGRWVKENNIRDQTLYLFKENSHSFDFYAQKNGVGLNKEQIPDLPTQTYVFTNEEGKEELLATSKRFSIAKTIPSYRISALSLPFLYSKTREKELENKYILVCN